MLPACPDRDKPGAKVVGAHTKATGVTGVTSRLAAVVWKARSADWARESTGVVFARKLTSATLATLATPDT